MTRERRGDLWRYEPKRCPVVDTVPRDRFTAETQEKPAGANQICDCFRADFEGLGNGRRIHIDHPGLIHDEHRSHGRPRALPRERLHPLPERRTCQAPKRHRPCHAASDGL